MEVNITSVTLAESLENDEKNGEVSKFRNYSSQIYAAFATNMVKLSAGTLVGFSTVLIAEHYKEDSEIEMSLGELSLLSSYCFAAPIGSLFIGMFSQWIGNRQAMLFSVTFFAISFLLFYFATNSTMILVVQAIAGFFSLISVGPGITYVVEITQPQLRSALTASTTLSTMVSAFLIVLLSNFLHWRDLTLVMLGFAVTGFVAVCTIPESPHWLASKKKFDEAEAALCWLRGWSSLSSVTTEFNALKKTYANPPVDLDFPTKKDIDRIADFKDRISKYAHKSFYIPLSMMCLLFTLQNCFGFASMVTYCIVIFKQINAPIDANVAASIFNAMRIFGALFCISFINRTGKKKLVFFSLLGAGLCFLTSSLALILKVHHIYPEICQWLAAITTMLTAFLTSCGIDKVVFILNAELFPTKYRHVGAGIGLFTSSLSGAIINKVFISMMNAFTVAGVFVLFGISAIVTCVIFHFLFPETEGKSLEEIHAQRGDVKSMEKEQDCSQRSTNDSAV